jgi:TrmH family RNA methyltransferase
MAMKPTKQQRAMLRSLRSAKGRDESGLFLVEGVRLCEELAGADLTVELVLVAEEEEGALSDLASRLQSKGATVVTAPLDEVRHIGDTVTGQGILAAAHWAERFPDELKFGAKARVIALDGVGDPGNVGSVVRCADWFGADAVLLGKGCADLLNPKTVRSTMGGMFHLPVCRDLVLNDALLNLKAQRFKVNAATMDGSPDWADWCAPERAALLLGSEARGISDDLLQLADRRITIPRRGRGDSLNVAVTAGILLSAL